MLRIPKIEISDCDYICLNSTLFEIIFINRTEKIWSFFLPIFGERRIPVSYRKFFRFQVNSDARFSTLKLKNDLDFAQFHYKKILFPKK